MAGKKNSSLIYKQVLDELKSGQLRPVYYLYGEEEFYLDRLLDQFSKIVPEEQKDFNFDLLYGQDVSPAQALGIARSFPMMAERRVVIIRNFLQIKKGGGDGTGDRGHINDFINYFESPNPSTLLLLIDEKKPHGNTNLGKAVSKNKQVGSFEFEELPDYMIPDWIMTWTKNEHNKSIDAEAAQLLGQFVGNDLRLLSTEIDKVCTFVDTSNSIEIADVKKVIGSYRDYTAIELKDAVLKRDLNQALYISEQILQHTKSDTGELIRIVGFFNSVFINIWQIRRLAESGMSQSAVQNAMGLNPWYFKRLWKDASQFRYHEMPEIFEALLDADRAIKGFSTMDPTSILFLLIRRMIG